MGMKSKSSFFWLSTAVFEVNPNKCFYILVRIKFDHVIEDLKIYDEFYQELKARMMQDEKYMFTICRRFCAREPFTYTRESLGCYRELLLHQFDLYGNAAWVTYNTMCRSGIHKSRLSNIPQQATFNVYSYTKCKEKFEPRYIITFVKMQFNFNLIPRYCIDNHKLNGTLLGRSEDVEEDGHPCQNDSGSALVVKRGNKYVQVGILSGDHAIEEPLEWPTRLCKYSNQPHLYVDVASNSMISSILQNGTYQCKNSIPV